MCAIKCLLPSPDRITKLQVHNTLFACVQTFSIDHSHVSFKSASTFIKTQLKVLSKKCNKNLHRTNCTPSVQMKLTWRKSCLNAWHHPLAPTESVCVVNSKCYFPAKVFGLTQVISVRSSITWSGLRVSLGLSSAGELCVVTWYISHVLPNTNYLLFSWLLIFYLSPLNICNILNIGLITPWLRVAVMQSMD